VVAGRHPGHAGADLLDDARALVAEHHREPALDVALHHVQVGVAQPGVGVPDQDLALLGAAELELLDLQRLAGLVDDGGDGFHGRFPYRAAGLHLP
jgi:hypothetical protein